MIKKCSKCKKEKNLSDYPRDKYNKSGHTSSCKECRYAKTNEWLKSNSTENKEKILQRKKIWRKENWDSVYKQRIESGSQARGSRRWYHNKGKYDIQHVLSERLRSRIRNVVKKGYKSAPTLELLGCSLEEFKTYLESKFTEGMTWDKILSGEIHIDHVRPCCSFDLSIEESQKECFHYTNLQPLWASENLKKAKDDRLLSIKK